MSNSPLVLDTHTWIWLNLGEPAFTQEVQQQIEHAASHANLFIPVIAIWELAMLEMKGRISFSQPIDGWVEKALSLPGLSIIPLTPQIALESCHLPGNFHGDPADRMIVASTRITAATLITADQRILAYAKEGHIKVLHPTESK